jgi:hypothetical protein
LQGICFVAHRHDVSHRNDNLVCPCALLVGGNNQHSLTLQGGIDFRSRFGDSANTLRPHREWEGRPDAVHALDEQKVRWIERSGFHRDENLLLAKSRFGDRVELDDIRGLAVSHELQLPHRKLPSFGTFFDRVGEAAGHGNDHPGILSCRCGTVKACPPLPLLSTAGTSLEAFRSALI